MRFGFITTTDPAISGEMVEADCTFAGAIGPRVKGLLRRRDSRYLLFETFLHGHGKA